MRERFVNVPTLNPPEDSIDHRVEILRQCFERIDWMGNKTVKNVVGDCVDQTMKLRALR